MSKKKEVVEEIKPVRYIGFKEINALPMDRGEYNTLRGWEVSEDENPEDEGYLVEYLDGGKSNHPDFKGYISWSPKEVFERAYFKVEDNQLDLIQLFKAKLRRVFM